MNGLRLFFLSMIVSVTVQLAYSQQIKEGTGLSFDRTEWDFGNINEVDGPVSHVFRFTNTTSAPVIIEKVLTTCGCTTPTFPHRPVYAGDSGEITVTYDPADRPGRFSKSVTIVTGNGKYRYELLVKGVVKARPRTVEDDYPYELYSGLRADEIHRSFSFVKQGGVKSMTVQIVNTSKTAIRLDTVWQSRSGFLRVAFPQSVPAGKKGVITLTYDFSKGARYGMLSDQFRLRVNGKDAFQPISADATGVDDLSGMNKKDAPLMLLSSGFVNFGKGKAGETFTKTLSITNSGKSPLYIRNVETRLGASTSLTAGTQIDAGQTREFSVTLSTQHADYGSLHGSVILIVNDPDRPMREIRLTVNIDN